MHAENTQVFVRDQFDKSVIGVVRFVSHRISLGNFGIMVVPDQKAATLFACLRLRHPDVGNLRMGEDGPGHRVVVDLFPFRVPGGAE